MRVGILGLGTVGSRLFDAFAGSDVEFVGAAVRSVTPSLLARPDAYVFVTEVGAVATVAEHCTVRGVLEDLLDDVDVFIDAGPSRSGAKRASLYARHRVKVIYCGGERDSELGPVVHPALNSDALVGRVSVRLPSCNTIAMGRIVAALGPGLLESVDATLIRCATDTDKAAKGLVNGLTFDAAQSHHATDLRGVAPWVRANSVAASAPMTSGHLIALRLGLVSGVGADRVRAALASSSRIEMLDSGAHATPVLATLDGVRHDRHRVSVQVADWESDAVFAWLSLDNQAVTVPECLDVVHMMKCINGPMATQRRTDEALGILADGWRRCSANA